MDQETFPVATSSTDGSKLVVGQLDLSELESCLAPSLSDPPAGFDPNDASRPEPAKPTAGPHRYTIYVPYDEKARINVGAPHPDHGEPGIAMRTKTHFHAWVGDGLDTSLSLGAPATTTCFGTNRETYGYALATAGHSNHIAAFQVAMTSAFSGMALTAMQDVRIDSKAMTVGITGGAGVTVSTPGHVSIEAGTDNKPNASFWSAVQAIGLVSAEAAGLASKPVGMASSAAGDALGYAADGGSFLKNFASDDAKALAEYTIRKNAEAINKTLGHVRTITELVLAFKKTKAKVEKAQGKLKKGIAAAPYIIAVVSEIAAVCKDLFGSADPEKKIGDVDITAHKNVNITADGSVNLSGFSGVNVSGFRKVTLNGLSCSMEAHKSSSIWGGLGAEVKALAGDVEIQSDLKGASVTAKKDVSITSEAAGVTIGGVKDVQLTSTTADAYVHGNKGAYIGAGSGKGMGVVMKSAYMTMGKHANVHEYKKTVNEKDCGVIKIVDKSVKTTVTQNSSLELTDDKHEVKTDTVKVTATRNVEIKGKKVLLG